MIKEAKNETTTKVKKVKVKEFSATPGFRRSREIRFRVQIFRGAEFGIPEKWRNKRNKRRKERKREREKLWIYRESGVVE